MQTAMQQLIKWMIDKSEVIPFNQEKCYDKAIELLQVEKQDMIDFLVWLKENHWHVYKDGRWFTSKDHAYIDGKPRKFYTEEQVIQKYNAEMANNVPYRVQNEAN